jgi:hypothetical protein
MFQLREWDFSLDESPDWDCLFGDSISELAKSPCPSVFQLLNCPDVLELYRERTNSTNSHNKDQGGGALSIQRLEGGRYCLRRARGPMPMGFEL